MSADELKRLAALAALEEVKSGDRLGLGTGSTARHFILELGRKLASGELKDIVGVATSVESERLAAEAGVPLQALGTESLDLAVDGADEIDPDLHLIKGLGGALLREKMTEFKAKRFVVVADDSKLVRRLGEKAPLPIEILPFGQESTLERLEALFPSLTLRMDGTAPFVTDNKNHIVHATLNEQSDIYAFERRLKGTLGVVESGLFLGMAARAYVACADGTVRTLEAPHGRPFMCQNETQ